MTDALSKRKRQEAPRPTKASPSPAARRAAAICALGLTGLVGPPLSPRAAPAASPPSVNGPVANAPEEIVVPLPRDPKVVDSFPANGAAVNGGSAIIKIVFDQPMAPEAWSYAPTAGGAFPACLAQPRLLADRRTFVLLCSLPLNTAFALRVNAAPDFTSAAGRLAAPFELRFRTTGDMTVAMEEALKAAGLKESDDPIMGTHEASGAMAAAPARPGTPPR